MIMPVGGGLTSLFFYAGFYIGMELYYKHQEKERNKPNVRLETYYTIKFLEDKINTLTFNSKDTEEETFIKQGRRAAYRDYLKLFKYAQEHDMRNTKDYVALMEKLEFKNVKYQDLQWDKKHNIKNIADFPKDIQGYWLAPFESDFFEKLGKVFRACEDW